MQSIEMLTLSYLGLFDLREREREIVLVGLGPCLACLLHHRISVRSWEERLQSKRRVAKTQQLWP